MLKTTKRVPIRTKPRAARQAVRIPVELEAPGDASIMRRDGDRLVIEPVRKRGLVALLKSMKPIEDSFPKIDERRSHGSPGMTM